MGSHFLFEVSVPLGHKDQEWYKNQGPCPEPRLELTYLLTIQSPLVGHVFLVNPPRHLVWPLQLNPEDLLTSGLNLNLLLITFLSFHLLTSPFFCDIRPWGLTLRNCVHGTFSVTPRDFRICHHTRNGFVQYSGWSKGHSRSTYSVETLRKYLKWLVGFLETLLLLFRLDNLLYASFFPQETGDSKSSSTGNNVIPWYQKLQFSGTEGWVGVRGAFRYLNILLSIIETL